MTRKELVSQSETPMPPPYRPLSIAFLACLYWLATLFGVFGVSTFMVSNISLVTINAAQPGMQATRSATRAVSLSQTFSESEHHRQPARARLIPIVGPLLAN